MIGVVGVDVVVMGGVGGGGSDLVGICLVDCVGLVGGCLMGV